MAQGTDAEILNRAEPTRTATKGRPEVNRDLARRLLQAKYSTREVANRLKCSSKTIYRIRDELLATGELTEKIVEEAETPISALDFDEESERATGTKFKEWLQNKRKDARELYAFVYRVWDQVWDRPSLVLLKNVDERLGDQLCTKFLTVFGEDKKRIRTRKKHIRQLFIFLGRRDLCDRYLTMTNSRDPRSVRRLPVIEMLDFPTRFMKAVEELPPEYQTAIKFKLVAQMRTGDAGEERGFYGIRKGTTGKSYLYMRGSEDADVRCHVLEKMREEWDITQIPKTIREELLAIYEKTPEGAFIFAPYEDDLIIRWKAASLKHLGEELVLHDLRKVSITWYYACRVPLEIATTLNVGWRDLNTPRDHYLHLRTLMKKSTRKVYADAIPSWFKEGLDEYREEKD